MRAWGRSPSQVVHLLIWGEPGDKRRSSPTFSSSQSLGPPPDFSRFLLFRVKGQYNGVTVWAMQLSTVPKIWSRLTGKATKSNTRCFSLLMYTYPSLGQRHA